MYVLLRHQQIVESTSRNMQRFCASPRPGSHNHGLRMPNCVSVPRKQGRLSDCRVGKSYDPDHATITVDDVMEVCKYTNDNTYVFVGTELRHYHLGTPMGAPGSCAKANGVGLDAEIRMDQVTQHDPDRNLSISYVDDKHARVAWSTDTSLGWSLESAQAYCTELLQYPKPLVME